jgi:signal transduction histidine kinase/ActR/RegA family two-component response regulator
VRLSGELAAKGQIGGHELVVRPAGGERHLLMFAKLMPFLDERLIMWVCVDVTARRRAEMEKAVLKERLSRSQTMESMGRMASSVAHELNNILSAQIGYPELLLKEGGLTPSQRAQISEIMDAGHRASAVVSDLLTLSRGVAKAKVAVDLGALAKEVVEGQAMAKAAGSAARPVELAVRAAPGAVLMASPSHLRKVVSNLVHNAVEVLADRGGRVEVSTGVRRIDAPPAGGPEDFVAGPHVVLTVADDGPGIADADLAHIFAPYYTRKSGSGRGLGLAMVELAVKEHGGWVEVETSPGGTAFHVFLPKAPDTAPVKGPARRKAPKGAGQKILVVDDVDIQRKLAQKMLRALGYEPHAVSSGEEAVDFLRDNDVDLIILDMVMDPGINGRQTYEAILTFKPWQKAIIASGLAENEEVARAQALGASHFVSKPYTLDDIAGAVHKALNPEGAGAPAAGAR